jgi:hypothetical protein
VDDLKTKISKMHLPRKSDRSGFSSGVHCTQDDERWPCAYIQTHGHETIASAAEVQDELLDHAVSRVRLGINRLNLEETWLSDLETVISAAYSNQRNGNDDDR